MQTRRHVLATIPAFVVMPPAKADERTGQKAEVTDGGFCMKGNVIFCTEKTRQNLERQVQ